MAPPNLLAAIVEWGIGTPEAELQPDGTPNDGEITPREGDLGLRVMGAGEEMELVNPVIAGTELVLETPRGGHARSRPAPAPACSSPPCNTFTSADGAVLNRNRRTVVLRNPVQES